MTTQGKSLEELGRRAVACKHWRWMPGMLTLKGLNDTAWRVLEKPKRKMHGLIITDSDAIVVCNRGEQPGVPNLSDPATLGCLLTLVREAWPDEWHEFIVPIFDGFSHWRVGCLDLQRLPGAPQLIVPINQETMKPLVWAHSEAEALVIALEAAP